MAHISAILRSGEHAIDASGLDVALPSRFCLGFWNDDHECTID